MGKKKTHVAADHTHLCTLGCSEAVAKSIVADERYAALPASFWINLIQKFGPVAFQVVEEILNGGNAAPPVA